ncbi:MAG: hypothetical protein V4559_00420 [Pseudomonadota bacterium]
MEDAAVERDPEKCVAVFREIARQYNRAPPAFLEWAVERLLPAPARENVIGDLREIYRGPYQYLREAMLTVPRIAAGHVWRNLNLPVLGLNGALIWLCLAGLRANGHSPNRMTIALAIAGGVTALVLSEIYGDFNRPTAQRAIKGAIWTVVLVIVLCVWNFGLRYQRIGGQDYLLEFGMLQSLPFVLPVLGLLRTCLLLQSDRQQERLGGLPALEDEHRAFTAAVWRTNRMEAAALIVGAYLLPHMAGSGLWLPAVFLATAAYLMAQTLVRRQSETGLRGQYRRQLMMRRQLRHFLTWLWAAPFLMAACRWLIWPGYEQGRAILVAFGTSAIVSICFLVRAADSECAGLLRERMTRLERAG